MNARKSRTSQILAIGGLVTASGNARLFRYLLSMAETARPAVGFIGTAGGDSPARLRWFRKTFGALKCRPSTLEFFDRTPDVEGFVAAQDVILVGGGNTKSMLAVWNEWDVPNILRRAWRNGTVLAGWSAGAICWFDQGLTDSFSDRLRPLDCLGFLPGSCCPHYDGEADRRPSYRKLIGEKLLKPGIAIEDGAAVHFRDRRILRLIASGGSAGAWSVRHGQSTDATDVVEEPLTAERVDL